MVVSSKPANNALVPSGTVPLSYTYSDNLAVIPASTTIQLQKWNGTAWVDTTGTGISSSSGVTATTATYRTNNLASGRYQATLTIADANGNQAQQSTIFSVDSFSVTVSTGSLSLGTLTTNTQALTSDITVTVTTLGSAFSLSLSGSGTMSAGLATIGTYNGSTGFGYDWSQTAGGSRSFSGALGVFPTTLQTNTANIDPNGNLKTYTYLIHYGAKVPTLQSASTYRANTKIHVQPSY